MIKSLFIVLGQSGGVQLHVDLSCLANPKAVQAGLKHTKSV